MKLHFLTDFDETIVHEFSLSFSFLINYQLYYLTLPKIHFNPIISNLFFPILSL